MVAGPLSWGRFGVARHTGIVNIIRRVFARIGALNDVRGVSVQEHLLLSADRITANWAKTRLNLTTSSEHRL